MVFAITHIRQAPVPINTNQVWTCRIWHYKSSFDFRDPQKPQQKRVISRQKPKLLSKMGLSEEESITVFGCVSEGFAISINTPGETAFAYCSEMLSVGDTQRILASFLRRDLSWKDAVRWKQRKPIVNRLISAMVVCVVMSIFVLLVFDLLGWW